jgi:hypothetical protein
VDFIKNIASGDGDFGSLDGGIGCFDAILGVIFFAASLASYLKIFACLFRGLSFIRTPFPSCGFVQRRLWVGAIEISGGLSTSIGCPIFLTPIPSEVTAVSISASATS